MKGSWPFIRANSVVFLISMIRSRALRFPGIEMVISRSPIVCTHLYGRAACSASSLARAAASSSLVGSVDVDVVSGGVASLEGRRASGGWWADVYYRLYWLFKHALHTFVGHVLDLWLVVLLVDAGRRSRWNNGRPTWKG